MKEKKESINKWRAISPTGEVFEFPCLAVFAREHNLSRQSAQQVVMGFARQHRGWRFYKIPQGAE